MWLLYAVLFILQVNMVRPQLAFTEEKYERTINSTTKGEVITIIAFGSGVREITYSTGSWNPESGSSIFSIDPQTGVIQVISQSDIPPGVYVAKVFADIADSRRSVSVIITVVPVDLCTPNPCQNGGVCNSSGGVAECTCPGGFSGDICDKEDCSEEEEEQPIHPHPHHNNYPHGYRHGRGHRHLKKIVKQIRKETKAVRKVLREIFKKVNKGRRG